MHLLSFLLFIMLPVSISAAVVDRIAYTPGSSEDTSNTLPELVRRENAITWWPDEEPQNACDADQDPQKTGGSQIFKWDCMAIQNFNNRSGRYTISGYYKQWAKINTMGSCTFAVSRDDDSTNDFEFGDQDIKECLGVAMDMYSELLTMQSVTGGSICDAADTTGNDVPIQWIVTAPEDIE